MDKKQSSKKKSKNKDNGKVSNSLPIDAKTNFVNGLGASAEFTSVD